MSKTEMLKINSSNIREEKMQINFMDLNKTKESFRDEKNNQNEFYDKNEFNKETKTDKKIKKVKFMEPMFVNIIEVESYKKFNEENTSKDPFDNINQEKENKAKVLCSCLIV